MGQISVTEGGGENCLYCKNAYPLHLSVEKLNEVAKFAGNDNGSVGGAK